MTAQHGFRRQVLALILVPGILAFLFFDVWSYQVTRRWFLDQQARDMFMRAALVERNLDLQLVEKRDTTSLQTFARDVKEIVACRVTIIDSSGVVLADSDVPGNRIPSLENHLYRPEVQQALRSGYGNAYRRSATIGRRLFYFARRLDDDRGRYIGFLRLAMYAKDVGAATSKLKQLLFLGTVISLVFFGALSGGLAQRIASRVHALASAADKVAKGDLDAPVPQMDKGELRTLSRSIEQMRVALLNRLDNVQRAYEEARRVLDNLAEGVVAVDVEQNIVLCNNSMRRLFDLDPKDLNKSLVEVTGLTELESLLNEVSQRPGHTLSRDFTVTQERGKRYLHVDLASYAQTNGLPWRTVIVFRDVTELRRLEAVRRDFVSNASHELKTPLTSILGYIDTILETPGLDPKRQIQYLKRIRSQAERLERLVYDLLTLARLEEERELSCCHETVNIEQVIRQCVAEFVETAQQRKQNLEFSCEPTLQVRGNRDLLHIALANLIDNAIKYTPEGGHIHVKGYRTDGYVRLEVRDTGIGIDPKYHDRIFQRFYRVDKSRSRASGGTGLGLAIVRHIAEIHAGKAAVESELGQGSVFWIELPHPHAG